MLDVTAQISPLWDPQDSFANTGDDEDQMVGQGLHGSVEAALEWRTDDPRGEKCILDDLSRSCSFLEGAAGDQ